MTIRYPSPEVMREVIKKTALQDAWTVNELKTALLDIHRVDEYFADPSRWSKHADMRDSGGATTTIAREACSHSLDQASSNFMKSSRSVNLILQALVHTNFTKEHISLERYGGPKVTLFNDHPKVTFTYIKNLLRCVKRGLREHLGVPNMQPPYVDQLMKECQR